MIIADIIAVSSGTLASLTGHTNADALDLVLDAWVDFELERDDAESESWQASWSVFVLSSEYATLCAKLT